jgi:hypothetical protein
MRWIGTRGKHNRLTGLCKSDIFSRFQPAFSLLAKSCVPVSAPVPTRVKHRLRPDLLDKRLRQAEIYDFERWAPIHFHDTERHIDAWTVPRSE